MSIRIDIGIRRVMAIIKSLQDIRTEFKHNDIFKQYTKEIEKSPQQNMQRFLIQQGKI